MQPLLYRAVAVLLLITFFGFVAAGTLQTTTDWEQAGALARARGVPVVMVVTGVGCGYCERMQQEFLYDPSIQAFLSERALIHIYHKDTGGKIMDFDGERVRARMFISRYEIFATPTVLLLDANGRILADPLVGYNDAVNYRDLITGRLDQAQLALATDRGEAAPAIATIVP